MPAKGVRMPSFPCSRLITAKLALFAAVPLLLPHFFESVSVADASGQSSFEFAAYCQKLCVWGRGGNLCRCNAVHFVGKRRTLTAGVPTRVRVDRAVRNEVPSGGTADPGMKIPLAFGEVHPVDIQLIQPYLMKPYSARHQLLSKKSFPVDLDRNDEDEDQGEQNTVNVEATRRESKRNRVIGGPPAWSHRSHPRDANIRRDWLETPSADGGGEQAKSGRARCRHKNAADDADARKERRRTTDNPGLNVFYRTIEGDGTTAAILASKMAAVTYAQ